MLYIGRLIILYFFFLSHRSFFINEMLFSQDRNIKIETFNKISNLDRSFFMSGIFKGLNHIYYSVVSKANESSIISINFKNGKTNLVLKNIDPPLSCFYNPDNKCFSLLYSTRYKYYDLKGNMINSNNVLNEDKISVLDFYLINRNIYLLNRNYNISNFEYYGIKLLKNNKEIIHLNRSLSNMPSRLKKIFMVSISNKLYLSFDDSLKVFCFENDGKFIKSAINKYYHYKKYSPDEINSFSESQKFMIKNFDPYPPIVHKLVTINEEKIGIVRNVRPLEHTIYLDIFSNDCEYLQTLNLFLPNNKIFIDIISEGNNLIIVSMDQYYYFSRISL